jgi:hypothetical protein
VGSVVRVTSDASASAPSLCTMYIFGKASAVVATKDRGPRADGTHHCGLLTSGTQTRISRSSNFKGPDASWRLRDNHQAGSVLEPAHS